MKVESSKDKLLQSVINAERVSGKNLNLPILNCILLETEKNQVKIKSTNLDLGLETLSPAKVFKEGSVVVPRGVLSGALSNIRDERVILELSNGNLTISSSGSNLIIKSLPNSDFPTIPKVEDSQSFKIEADKFSSGIKSVWYSASISSMKPELSSVYIYQDDGGSMVFVATDSFRLAEKKIKVKKGGGMGMMEDSNHILLPFKNIPEIIKILEEAGSKEVLIALNKNQISFSFDNIYLTSRIIDSVFPDYKQIIPKEFKTEVGLLKQDFVDALKMANIFSGKFHQVTIKIEPKNKIFEIKTSNPDIGESLNKIEATVDGEGMEISFNHKYLVDCLQSISADSLFLSFSGVSKPMIIKGTPEDSFMYLVMPMNK